MSTTQPYATMSDALRDWLQRHVTEGFEAESLVASMVQSGYDRAFARRVVDEALTARAPAPIAAPAPTPVADQAVENSNAVHTADGDIPILFAIETPRIVLFQHFLSDAECDELIAIGRNRARDVDVQKALKAQGWKTLIVWECETRDAAKLSTKLARFLGS